MTIYPYNFHWRMNLDKGHPRYAFYRPWRAELEEYLDKQNLSPKLYSAIHRLKKSNCIRIKNIRGKDTILITKKGQKRVVETKIKIAEKKQRRDKRWVMVIFDIPEKERRSRNMLRKMLYELGYKIFQKSVWVAPYDVLNETEEIIKTLHLEKFVNCFLVEEVEVE
jgi:phenylacetic acid degradation operon negative regulatory protein